MAEAPSRSKDTRTGAVPLAVWPVAQVSAQYQRAGRYHPDSSAHPGKMLPALARRIVEEYSEPGALVVDPMAGIGTTLVEAAALGRRAVGVELESRWVALARQNLDCALSPQQRRLAQIRRGDARRLPTLISWGRSTSWWCRRPTPATQASWTSPHGSRDERSATSTASTTPGMSPTLVTLAATLTSHRWPRS